MRPYVGTALAALLLLAAGLSGSTAGDCTPVEPQEPVCEIEDCGPSLGMPIRLCDDQVNFGGPTGECLPTADGGCGWEIAECPEPCAPEECQGHRMLAPNVLCDDGTLGGPVCLRNDDGGECWWELRSCP